MDVKRFGYVQDCLLRLRQISHHVENRRFSAKLAATAEPNVADLPDMGIITSHDAYDVGRFGQVA